MPENMNKEDIPCRTASLTFTIDNILNLKKNNNFDAYDSKTQTDSGFKDDFQRRYGVYDVRSRHESDCTSQETGESTVDLNGLV